MIIEIELPPQTVVEKPEFFRKEWQMEAYLEKIAFLNQTKIAEHSQASHAAKIIQECYNEVPIYWQRLLDEWRVLVMFGMQPNYPVDEYRLIDFPCALWKGASDEHFRHVVFRIFGLVLARMPLIKKKIIKKLRLKGANHSIDSTVQSVGCVLEFLFAGKAENADDLTDYTESGHLELMTEIDSELKKRV